MANNQPAEWCPCSSILPRHQAALWAQRSHTQRLIRSWDVLQSQPNSSCKNRLARKTLSLATKRALQKTLTESSLSDKAWPKCHLSGMWQEHLTNYRKKEASWKTTRTKAWRMLFVSDCSLIAPRSKATMTMWSEEPLTHHQLTKPFTLKTSLVEPIELLVREERNLRTFLRSPSMLTFRCQTWRYRWLAKTSTLVTATCKRDMIYSEATYHRA